jgi:tRNA (guanine9-N1)-methyltransferase
MSDAAYKRWVNTEWWYEGYERLWQTTGESLSMNGDERNSGEIVTLGIEPSGSEALQQSVTYLTADSEEELTELKPEETYVIGGICDHNRYKVASTPAPWSKEHTLFLILVLESLPQ